MNHQLHVSFYRTRHLKLFFLELLRNLTSKGPREPHTYYSMWNKSYDEQQRRFGIVVSKDLLYNGELSK